MDRAGRLRGRSRPHPFGRLSTVTALVSPGFAFLAAWRRAAELAGRRYGTGTTTRGECPALPTASATLA
jgi:hypothetical protein